MAPLVFQLRPEELHLTEPAQPNRPALVGNLQLLDLGPGPFVEGDQPVAFQGKEEPQRVVSHRLEVIQTTVPTVPGDNSRFQTPRQHFSEHVLKIVVFSLPLRLGSTTLNRGHAAPTRSGG